MGKKSLKKFIRNKNESLGNNNRSKKNVKQYSRKDKINKIKGGTIDEKFKKLLQRITSNTHPFIKKLDISNNEIGDAGLLQLSEALKHNTTITDLNISNNEITFFGIIGFAKALINKNNGKNNDITLVNRTIKKLNISENSIGDNGVKALADALKENNTLIDLNISDNNIENYGAQYLAEAVNGFSGIDGNKTLKNIDITDNNIGEDNEIKFNKIINDPSVGILIKFGININKIIKILIIEFNPKLDILDDAELPEIIDTIEFIKKNMKYKNLNKNDTDETIFREYIKQFNFLGSESESNSNSNSESESESESDKYFNALIKHNYDSGIKAIDNIINTETYILQLHGNTLNSIFKLPDNINVIFISPTRYMTCENFEYSKPYIIKYYKEFIENPYCISNPEINKIFRESLIYYGGQYCIDLMLSRKIEDHVKGLHYMGKDNVTNYKIEQPYKFTNENLTTTLSYFLQNQNDKDGKQFNKSKQNYTIIITSCRETKNILNSTENNLEKDDILVFYEQTLKRLNFKVNFDKKNGKKINKENNENKTIEAINENKTIEAINENKTNNMVSNNEDNLNKNYKHCKTIKNNKIYLNRIVTQTQFERKEKKGKTKSRNDIILNNKTILINGRNVEYNIQTLKELILNININDKIDKIKCFETLFGFLNIQLRKLEDKNAIPLDTKLILDIIKMIFGNNYLLMFDFLVYCQLHINTFYEKSNNNRKTNVFFLEFCYDKIEELKSIDITEFHDPIDIKILYFISNTFANSIKNLDISNNNFGDEGALKLSELLSETQITYINISKNKISHEGIKYLIDALKNNKTLEIFNINDNEIGDEGAIIMAKALPTLVELKELYIGNNQIGDKGAENLSGSLQFIKKLEKLDVSSNQIGDKGAKHFASALEAVLEAVLKIKKFKPTSFKILDISQNLFDELNQSIFNDVVKTNFTIIL